MTEEAQPEGPFTLDTAKNLERVRFLEGDRIFLTPECADDFDVSYRWQHDREMQALGGVSYVPTSPERFRREFEDRLQNKNVVLLTIIMSDTGAPAGLINLFSIRQESGTAEWGLVLDQNYRRRGIGTEAARLLLGYAFDTLGLRRVTSETHSGNEGSQALQIRLGCVREATLRQGGWVNNQIVDRIFFGLLREEYREAKARWSGPSSAE
ncbi:MAG: GNAT family N-acetyltransferase [candidate division Zixibacteria bacterium]|nr:GNAT family N-acetyltransferase [candidate division Zixibacteria bacterium]